MSKYINKTARLKKEIEKRALERLKIDKLEKDKKLTDPNSKWYGQKLPFAMATFAFYKVSCPFLKR